MESHTGLTGADYAVIAVYIIGIVLLGTYAGRRQKNTEDFLLAGRSMRWWPIAISLFAAFFSSISSPKSAVWLWGRMREFLFPQRLQPLQSDPHRPGLCTAGTPPC